MPTKPTIFPTFKIRNSKYSGNMGKVTKQNLRERQNQRGVYSALEMIDPSGFSDRPKSGDPTCGIRSFEDILELIRPLGKWQAWLFFLIAYIQFWQAMVNLAVVFFGIDPPFHCALPAQNKNWTFKQTQNISAPFKEKDELDTCRLQDLDYRQLSAYNFTQVMRNINETLIENNGTLDSSSCNSWVYDTTNSMSLTIVNQWDLVCDKEFLVEHTQLVYMFGFLVGSFFAGFISDLIGRKTTAVVMGILCTLFSIAQGYAPNYGAFLAIRFFMSLSNIGHGMAAFTLTLEVTTNRFRTWVGGLYWLPYAFGYTTLALIAYLTRDWRTMHLVISLPNLLIVFYFWLLPESPRWLLIKDKIKRAEETLQWAARWNGRTLPDNLDYHRIAAIIREEDATQKSAQVHFFQIFKYKPLAIRAVNLFFNWLVNAMVYYGISLSVSSFAGSVFINNAIAGAVEIPAYVLSVPLMFWSRKYSLSLTLLLAGVSLFIVPWLPPNVSWLKTTFAMIGKLGITASFGIVYVFTLELYPTPVRTSGLATSSCVARIGSMVAPYIGAIRKKGKSYEWIPLIIMGVLSLAAGFLALLLPDTARKRLPDTFQDAINLADEKSKNTNKSVRAEGEFQMGPNSFQRY